MQIKLKGRPGDGDGTTRKAIFRSTSSLCNMLCLVTVCTEDQGIAKLAFVSVHDVSGTESHCLFAAFDSGLTRTIHSEICVSTMMACCHQCICSRLLEGAEGRLVCESKQARTPGVTLPYTSTSSHYLHGERCKHDTADS